MINDILPGVLEHIDRCYDGKNLCGCNVDYLSPQERKALVLFLNGNDIAAKIELVQDSMQSYTSVLKVENFDPVALIEKLDDATPTNSKASRA